MSHENYEEQAVAIKHVRIVGMGLIGTSIGLGLASKGVSLEVEDTDPKALAIAQDLLQNALKNGTPDLVVIATPPEATFAALKREYGLNPSSRFIDVGSVKSKLQQEVHTLSELKSRFVGSHPMAGRENSGPASAQADLFTGRAWFLTPSSYSDSDVVESAKSLIELLGATSYVWDADDHDELMAQISHLPQLISSALSILIENRAVGVDLAGQGLRDMTRLGAGDAQLWTQIFLSNKEPLLSAIRSFQERIAEFQHSIIESDEAALQRLIKLGNAGRSKVGGKHGAQPRNYSYLHVVIKDEPGALSELFNECAALSANIEDLSIEHSPGQYTGLITLAFSPEDAQRVQDHLIQKNWKVHRQ